MNLDFDALYAESSGEAFASGKKRFYDSRVSGIAGGFEESGKFKITACVSGRSKYNTSITFDETGGLYDYSCDCSVFSFETGPCKHIVATALSYEDRFPQKAEAAPAAHKAHTDAVALNLSKEYSRRKHRRFLGGGDNEVNLIPTLKYIGDGKLALKFSIGKNKNYALKDVSDFVSAVHSSGYRRYGVNLELEHHIQNFAESSRPLVKFVVESFDEKVESAGSGKAAARDELPLLRGDMDEFMSLFDGRLVQFDDLAMKDGVRIVVAGVDTLDSRISVEKVDDGYKITTDLPDFKVAAGRKYVYLITDSRIHRLSREFAEAELPLLSALNVNKKIFVSESDMPTVYNSVLFSAAQYMPIESYGVDLSVYEAAPLCAKIYINSEKGGVIGATLECSYDDEKVDIFNVNGFADTMRDTDGENGLKDVLKKYFPNCPDLTLGSEADIYSLMTNGLKELYDYADIYLEDAVKRMKVRKPPRIKVGVRLDSGLLRVDLDAEDYTQEEIKSVLSAYREKRNYIRLSDGSFVDLIDPSIRSLSEILEISDGKKSDITLPTYYAPFLNSELKEGFFELSRDAGFKELIKNLYSTSDLDIAVPAELKSVMRNYQKTGFRWLKSLSRYGFGGILADDMGLGKSLQIIALLKSEKEAREAAGDKSHKPSIIVCPTTLVLNWVNEFNKFAPDMRVLPVLGKSAERQEKAVYAEEYDVVITSYELLRRDDDLYSGRTFDYAVIDEAQYIKNPDTKNAKSVKKLAAAHKFALTGTPVENSLAELWSIFDFIMPRYLFSYNKFKERFETEIVGGNATAADKLNKLVSPFILRRLKSEVLTELPPKIETDLISALEGEQEKLYRSNLALVRENVRNSGAEMNKVAVLSMLTKLRQICCSPSLVYPDYKGNSSKLETCLDLIGSATESGHKILLFSQFTSMLDIIRKELSERGITYFILKGDTPKSERMRLIKRFNSDDTQVFLISLKAGGTGLNLTGADVVIHYDPWWNESVMNQATDRAYRIGQDKPVQVYRLTVKDTVEQKILDLQRKKTALSSAVLGSVDKGGKVPLDELLAILGE